MKLMNSFLFIVIPLIGICGCKADTDRYSISIILAQSETGDSLFLSRNENGKPVIIQKAAISSGKTLLSGNQPLRPGMYTAAIGSKGTFDFFISDTLHQKFSISADLKNLPSTLDFENSEENDAFIDFRRFLDKYANQQNNLRIRMRRYSESPDSAGKINNAYMMLNVELIGRTETLKNKFPGSMLALYIGLIREPQVPEPDVPSTVTNRQQFMQEYYFNYVSGHFFDHFDFSDARIVTIPVFEEKTGFYFRQMVPPLPDSIMARVEMLAEKSNSNDEVYKFTIRFLYRLFRESSLPELMGISDRIGEAYILPEPARWKDDAFVGKVRDRVTRAKLNPVGAVATDLKLRRNTGETIRLSEVKAPLTVLYFFNPECEACGPITGQLLPVYRKFRSKGIEVFAVYLDRKTETWKQYIAGNNLDWINVYDQDGTEGIEAKYDIYAIPMIYLLDREKRIIARDVPVNTLEELILRQF